jgi:hypothetical protein
VFVGTARWWWWWWWSLRKKASLRLFQCGERRPNRQPGRCGGEFFLANLCCE